MPPRQTLETRPVVIAQNQSLSHINHDSILVTNQPENLQQHATLALPVVRHAGQDRARIHSVGTNALRPTLETVNRRCHDAGTLPSFDHVGTTALTDCETPVMLMSTSIPV